MHPSLGKRFEDAVQKGERVLGAWMQLRDSGIAEIYAGLGYDFCCIDMEHGSIGRETAANCFRALRGTKTAGMVRIGKNDSHLIAAALEDGAQGVIVPMIRNAKEAEAAVAAGKYRLRRGVGYNIANGHGRFVEEYLGDADENLTMIMQIENRDAIDDLENICRVEGVQGCFIGPYDLSNSYGRPGDFDCPEMVSALGKFIDVCGRCDVAAGMHILTLTRDHIEQTFAKGYNWAALSIDVVTLCEQSAAILEFAGRTPPATMPSSWRFGS